MKMNAPSDKGISISILTNTPEDVNLVRKTLLHIYPGAVVTQCRDEARLPEQADILLIDTETVSGAKLERILDMTHTVPAILIVSDFAKVRLFSELLTSRSSIISRVDLSGMGLISGVHHLLERLKLQEQLKKASRHLKELSIRDELTKLFNHRHLDELLSTEVKKANRYRRPLALVIIAIKDFATINNSSGELEGNRILAKAAEIIKGAVREVDIPARYGDDEFAIILPESDEKAAAVVAERIKNSMASIAVPAKDADIRLATSTGIGTLSEEIQTKDELLRTALSALIEAKKTGPDSICTAADIASKKNGLKENRRLVERLSGMVRQISGEAERNCFQSVMKLLSEMPHAKKVLFPHSERVAFFAQRLAESAGVSPAETKAIHRAGFLHDAGKLAIDAGILSKPARLSNSEEELMRLHPALGTEIIGSSPFFTTEPDTILYHHEKFDGSGYPNGISGKSIPLSARILAIAEAWDTMITPQVYRSEALGLDAALMELKKGAGTQFDPELVDKFTSLIAG